ncbi:MAG TPA: HAD hydrolase family protein [Anaerolineales bacterium]|nr:HAD hydrolase family protein [Anaerolineales bacterium]
MPEISPEVWTRIKQIRLLALDSDGVLTDGGVYMTPEGQEFRRFDIKDGAGLKAVLAAGIPVAIISSAKNQTVLYRGQQLGISEVHVGVEEKLGCLQKVCARYNVPLSAVCYVGDDDVDLPVFEAVGFSCAPSDAVGKVLARADFVLSRPGGHGAVREICDLITFATLQTDQI